MPDQVEIPVDSTWGLITNALNSMFDVIFGRTGWASYVDTQYTSGSPFAVLSDTDTVLPNNAGTVVDAQKPTYITEYYDGSKILGRNGDGLAVQIYFKAESSIPDQWIDLWIDIGSGTPIELYTDTKGFPKGSGTERGFVYSLPSAYTLDTWEANGGTVYMLSNGACDVYDIVFNFTTTHKAR